MQNANPGWHERPVCISNFAFCISRRGGTPHPHVQLQPDVIVHAKEPEYAWDRDLVLREIEPRGGLRVHGVARKRGRNVPCLLGRHAVEREVANQLERGAAGGWQRRWQSRVAAWHELGQRVSIRLERVLADEGVALRFVRAERSQVDRQFGISREGSVRAHDKRAGNRFGGANGIVGKIQAGQLFAHAVFRLRTALNLQTEAPGRLRRWGLTVGTLRSVRHGSTRNNGTDTYTSNWIHAADFLQGNVEQLVLARNLLHLI